MLAGAHGSGSAYDTTIEYHGIASASFALGLHNFSITMNFLVHKGLFLASGRNFRTAQILELVKF
jgi:hypothetical protein